MCVCRHRRIWQCFPHVARGSPRDFPAYAVLLSRTGAALPLEAGKSRASLQHSGLSFMSLSRCMSQRKKVAPKKGRKRVIPIGAGKWLTLPLPCFPVSLSDTKKPPEGGQFGTCNPALMRKKLSSENQKRTRLNYSSRNKKIRDPRGC